MATLREYTHPNIHIYAVRNQHHRDLSLQHSPVKDLKHNPLMNSELGNDMGQEEVSVVLGSWVHTLLGEETGPGEGHESA